MRQGGRTHKANALLTERKYKMNTYLLIDGHNLLFQMFFGMPARIVSKSGIPIQGVMGFVGAFIKICRLTSPTRIGVIFDSEHNNPRHELDINYKANRPSYADLPDEENPFSQLPYIYSALKYMRISHAEAADCETDDIIAAYTRKYGSHSKVIISSHDSDFFQLVTKNVSILRYRGKNSVICDKAYIKERFGILPSKYADFKALTGDRSDNIKGADRVGPKTAALLLSKYGSLDNIIANSAQITKPSIRKSIQESADRLKINQKLITLDGNAALPFQIHPLRTDPTSYKTKQVLKAIGL